MAETHTVEDQFHGLWRRRWRLFFLATAGLFSEAGGDVWGVSHYRLKSSAGAA